jgi:hypothetical protein
MLPGPRLSGLLYDDIHCNDSLGNIAGSFRHVTSSNISFAVDDEGRDVTSTTYPRMRSGHNIAQLQHIKQYYNVTVSDS